MIDMASSMREAAAHTLCALVATLSTLESSAADDADRVDLIGLLEDVKGAAEAAQAALTRDLHASVVDHHTATGLPRDQRGRGVALQVALARRTSHHRARSFVGLARALPVDLPQLHAVWRTGRVTEHRVRQVLAQVVHLDADDRRAVDTHLAGTAAAVERLVGSSDRETVAEAARLACAADPAGAVRRRAAAEADRHVTSRPAPDTMLRLSALLPVAEGVAVMAALRAGVHTAPAGETRSGGQLMADTLVARVTGRDPQTTPVPVHLDVTVPLDALVGEGDVATSPDAAGWLDGHGDVPPDLVRSLAADAADTTGLLRRLLTDPATGQLVAMESSARCFPPALATYLRRRDRYCRHPWCDAPIRHSDHVVPVAEGGPTTIDNGQGLCEACNHAKQAPGWRAKARTDPDGTHVVEITTPTGHVHESRPPPAGSRRRRAEHHTGSAAENTDRTSSQSCSDASHRLRPRAAGSQRRGHPGAGP